MPRIGNTHTTLLFGIGIVNNKGCLRTCFADNGQTVDRWDELILSILAFKGGHGIDDLRANARHFIGSCLVVLAIVIVPVLAGTFPDLNDHILSFAALHLDFLTQLIVGGVGAQINADGLSLLFLLMTTHIVEIIKGGPAFIRKGTKLYGNSTITVFRFLGIRRQEKFFFLGVGRSLPIPSQATINTLLYNDVFGERSTNTCTARFFIGQKISEEGYQLRHRNLTGCAVAAHLIIRCRELFLFQGEDILIDSQFIVVGCGTGKHIHGVFGW